MASPPVPDNNPILVMDNSGRGALRVPGFGGIPINYKLSVEARFAHGFREWRQCPPLTAQELAMVAVMNWLTDKPAWFDDVFDDTTVAQWRAEMDHDLERIVANPMLMHLRLMKGDRPWDWCVQELRDKAVTFKKHRYVRILDTGSAVCKADAADLQALGATLRCVVGPLADEYDAEHKRVKWREDKRSGPSVQDEGAEPSAQDEDGEWPEGGEDDGDWIYYDIDERLADATLKSKPALDERTIEQLEKVNLAAAIEEESLHDIYWRWKPAHGGKPRVQSTCTDMISSLVDPMLFPLIYGRTPVYQNGGTVSLDNSLASYGATKPTLASGPAAHPELPLYRQCEMPWSKRYQSLPCDVVFTSGNDHDNDVSVGVQIVSYINGLHPSHPDTYRAIEQVLSRAIRPWNDCLIRGHSGMHDEYNLGQLGPVPARIITYGIEWENELGDWADAFNVPTKHRLQDDQEARDAVPRLPEHSSERERAQEDLENWHEDIIGKDHMQLPPLDSDLWQCAKAYLELPEPPNCHTDSTADNDWAVGSESTWNCLGRKARRIVRHRHPEPGTAFSYQQWKQGSHGSRPVVDKGAPRHGDDRPLVVPPHMGYSVALQDRFRDQGLQVVVRIDSIDLTPTRPAYAPDAVYYNAVRAARCSKRLEEASHYNRPVYVESNFDFDGFEKAGRLLNDHIVAAAVFAFDVDNVTEPRLDFRQKTPMDFGIHSLADNDNLDDSARSLGKDDINALAEILGVTGLAIDPSGDWIDEYQHIGSVALPQGRLVTFPDALDHRLQPFRLVDATKPGRFRWLTLSLVDPHYRLCSTRNVPPQQHDWWAREAGAVLKQATKLPQELVDQILAYADGWPMGIDEARRHRREMEKDCFVASMYLAAE